MTRNLTRRTFVKASALAAGACALGPALASCGPDQRDAKVADPHQVTIALPATSEPEAGFDPFFSWGDGEHVHEPLIQSTLVTTDTELNFQPDLATSWEFSPDGLVWTFHLRKDVKFTDGQPLTAKDVAFTLNGIAANDSAEADLSMLEAAEAPADDTAVLRLKRPFNALLYTLANVGICPAHAHGKDYGEKPIGSGRYMLEKWDRGQQAILVANPDYYGAKPNITRLVVLFMDEDAALAAAKAGKVDVAFTAATFAKQQVEGYDLLNCASVDSRGISLPVIPSGSTREDDGKNFPAGNDVTCDRALRQAMNYAVDRQRMIDNVLNGYGRVAYSVGDGMPWSSPDMKVDTDVERARKILADGGWKPGADGTLEKDGRAAAFELLYSSSDSVRQAIAVDFADQMKQIGIRIEPKGLSWDDLRPHEFSTPVVWGWGSNAPTEVYYLNDSKGWGNFSCYDNPTTDKYLNEALAQNDLAASYPYWQKAQWDGQTGPAPQGDATWVWFANIDHLFFVRNKLDIAKQKMHPHGHGWTILNNVDQWKWS